ncbi:MAG: type IX secretion system protein PorQ [Bacteroidetes bacterium]|nr:type IX secretion system protein PorQ [Bacteroidota bacterium]
MKAFFRPILLLLFCVSLQIPNISAQTAGNNTFDFLSLTNSARLAGLGSSFAAIHDDDISLTLANPSLISSAMHNKLAFSYVSNYSKVNYGYASYGRSFSKAGNLVGSLQFIDYGQMKYADETGLTSGQFNAGEYAASVGWGKMLDSTFSIGANAKLLYSDLESYNSFGLAVDVAGSYIPNNSTCISVVFQNIGRQLTSYTSNGVSPLPFEIQAGISRRLAHLPFRFSLVLQHLEKWDLTYTSTSTEIDPFTGQAIKKNFLDNFGDKAMRHVVLGGEFIPAKFLSLRFGFDYKKRKEMKVETKPGTVGFSFGFGINVSKFSINYSRAAYHIVGSRNYITLTTNLGDWVKK